MYVMYVCMCVCMCVFAWHRCLFRYSLHVIQTNVFCSGLTLAQLDKHKVKTYKEREIADLAGNAFNKSALFVCLSIVFAVIHLETPEHDEHDTHVEITDDEQDNNSVND